MYTRRHLHGPIHEPNYEFSLVPKASLPNHQDKRKSNQKSIQTVILNNDDNKEQQEKNRYDSVVIRLDQDKRDVWDDILGELVLLCFHAEIEFEKKMNQQRIIPITSGKPLSLEYITDRVYTDDPLSGFIVRTRKEGWLQGFISCTTFTTWQRWFKWDSLHEEAGNLPFDDAISDKSKGIDMDEIESKSRKVKKHQWQGGRKRKKKKNAKGKSSNGSNSNNNNNSNSNNDNGDDSKNESMDVESENGDVANNEQLEHSQSKQEENFSIQQINIGTDIKNNGGIIEEEFDPNLPIPRTEENILKFERKWWSERLIDADGRLARALENQIRDGDPNAEGVIWPHVAEISLLGGLGCGSWLVTVMIEELEKEESPYDYVVLQAAENSVPFYEKHGFIRVGAISRYEKVNENEEFGFNFEAVDQEPKPRDDYISDVSSGYYESEKKKKRKRSKPSKTNKNATPKASKTPKSSSKQKEIVTTPSQDHSEEFDNAGSSEMKSAKKRKRNRTDTPKSNHGGKTPMKQGGSENGDDEQPIEDDADYEEVWADYDLYQTKTKEESSKSIAMRFNVAADDVFFLNKRRVNDLVDENSFYPINCVVRLPKPSSREIIEPFVVKQGEAKKLIVNDAKPGCASSNGLWYSSLDHETPIKIANKLGVDVRDLIEANKHRYEGLAPRSTLMLNTTLRAPNLEPNVSLLGPDAKNLPPRETNYPQDPSAVLQKEINALEKRATSWLMSEAPQENLTPLTAYRHWSFMDDPIANASPSYMMARPLRKKKDKAIASNDDQLMADKFKEVFVKQDIYATKKPFSTGEAVEAIGKGTDWLTSASISDVTDADDMNANAQNGGSDGNVERGDGEALVEISAIENSEEKNKPQYYAGELIPEGYRGARLTLKLKGSSMSYYGPAIANLNGDAPIYKTGGANSNISDVFGKEEVKVRLSVSSGLIGPIPMIITTQVFPLPPIRKPDRPSTAYQLYFSKNSKIYHEPGLTRKGLESQMQKRWQALSVEEKKSYMDEAHSLYVTYVRQLKEYKDAMATTVVKPKTRLRNRKEENEKKKVLFNKIVTLKPKSPTYLNSIKKWADMNAVDESAISEALPKYKYYFILTYIPDLNWCTVVPLYQNGLFDENTKGESAGRPRWILVPETMDHELDVSASRCEIVYNAHTIHGCDDADDEEWDIIEEEERIAALEKSQEQEQSTLEDGTIENNVEQSNNVEAVTAGNDMQQNSDQLNGQLTREEEDNGQEDEKEEDLDGRPRKLIKRGATPKGPLLDNTA